MPLFAPSKLIAVSTKIHRTMFFRKESAPLSELIFLTSQQAHSPPSSLYHLSASVTRWFEHFILLQMFDNIKYPPLPQVRP